MTELSQTIAKKVLLFLLACFAIQGRALDPDVGQTVFDVVPLQEDAFSGRLDPVADVGFTISDRLGTFAGGIRLVPAAGVPKHYVGAGSEFRWRLFKDGAMADEGAWSDAAHGTGLTINHDFQRGANYTLIAGYYHFGTCPGIIYRPAPCLAADVQLRWRIQPEGTNLPDLSTSGDCPYELAFDGPDTDPLPRACTFRYLDRELAVSFDHTSSEWEDYDGGKATNYNSRIVLADRYETVHWILRGDHNFNYTQTLSTAVPGGADPKVFIMPDLSENATMQTVETGYTLYVQVEDAYGVTGSATPQLITSLRDLRIPNVLSWTLNFSENPRPITQTEQVGIAGLHKSLTSCYFPYDLHQNVGFQLAQWGPSSLRLAPPESDYSLSYALYITADILGGGTGVLGLPANNGHELHIQDFEDRYTWKSNGAGPGYPEDDYIEIGLYQVTDERSTNMVSAGDQPLNVNDWRAGNYPHRLRLHAREGSDSACQIPSSVTFFEDNAPVDTYYVTSNQDTLEVDFRADWDLFQFPDDHFRGLKVTFERNGQPIDNVQVENPWSACATGNPILHRIQEHHLRIHDPGRLDGATMKIGLIQIDQDTDCAIEVPDVTGSVRLAVDDNGIDSFGGLFFTSSNDSMHGNLPVGKVDPSGIGDFSFSADATGTPVFVEWLWYKQNPNGTCVYWNGSAWNGFACPEPDGMPAEGSQVGSSIQAFSGRWTWDQVDIAPDPTKPPPFEGELESLFGIADGIEVTVLARVRFTGGNSQIGRTTFYLQPDTVTPTRFTGLRVGQGPGTSHDASVSYAVGEAETVTFQIGTNDTSDQAGFHQVRVFLSELASPDNPITPPSCDALSTHAGTIGFMDLGAGNSYYTFNLGAGSLRDRLNQPGIYRMAIYPEPGVCSGTLPVSMKVTLTVTDPNGSPDPTIQPDLLVRLHYRDHLGSSMTAKAFSVAGDIDGGTLLMTPTGGTSFMLLGEDREDTWYDPFGNPLDTNVASNHRARYTDHERDAFSGLNYMKGRYQMADNGRFNRPDPMRDWDWQNPQSINLYEYVRNDPMNGHDPTGFAGMSETVDDQRAGQAVVHAFADGDTSAAVTFITMGITAIPIGVATLVGGPAAMVTETVDAGLELFGINIPLSVSDLGEFFAKKGTKKALTEGADDGLEKAVKSETTLYRAVMPDELQDIQEASQFINRGSAEGKYFTTTSEAASDYSRQAVKAFKDPPYTTVKTIIPTQSLPEPVDVDGGIPAYVIPDSVLPTLKPEELNHMALPRKR